MVSGYYVALERTMFAGEVDAASRAIWEANVAAHDYGMSLLKPGVSCAEVTHQINAFFEARDLLQYRTFGYGHSFGILSHYYGREAGLELREDIDTVLEPGMVISMEPMLTLGRGSARRGWLPRARHPRDHRGRQREHHRLSLRPRFQRGRLSVCGAVTHRPALLLR